MQGVKISWVGRSFALAAPSDSCGHKKSGRRKTREERHTMIKSFVEKYKTSNKGDFPSISLTHKEVGGSYYTVREIMRELKQEHKLCDTLGMDLDVTEPEGQVGRHVVQPLSIPGEISMVISSSSCQVVESNLSLEPMAAKYQDVLPDKEEQEIFIDNGSVESCGHNDQTLAKQENQVVDSPLRTIAAPMLLGMEHLQEVKKGQSLEKKDKNESKSFMRDENPNNENTHDLAIVSHIHETGVVGNGSVMESYSSQVENVCKHESPKTREQEFKEFHGNKSSAVIVGNESMMKSYISHVENVSKHEASNVWEQEFNVIQDKTSSAVISLFEDAALTELQSSYDLGLDSFEKQNLPEPLEKLEVAFPAVLENESLSVTKKMPACDSPLAENSSCVGYSEGYDTHSPLDTTQPVYSTSDSHSTTCLTQLPVDLVCGANHDEESSLLLNSTNNMLEEPTTLADRINPSTANFHTAGGDTAEIQDGMMECLTELPVDLTCGANHDEESSLLLNSTNNMLEEPTTLANRITSSMANFHTAAGDTAEIQDGMMECLTELPVDLACGANHDEESSLLSNSTNNMLEEPTTLAERINSSMANFHTAAGDTAEIQDGMMECQQLSSPNIDQEHMLSGVQAFYRVLLHQLALSALVIQTLVHTLGAHQNVSSELQCENLNDFSSSNCNGDLTGKTTSVSLSIVPQQGQGESIGNKKQSMQNNGNDENPISISENIDGTSANTECFEGPKKQENNIFMAVLKTIAEGILYLFKE